MLSGNWKMAKDRTAECIYDSLKGFFRLSSNEHFVNQGYQRGKLFRRSNLSQQSEHMPSQCEPNVGGLV